LGLIYYQYKEYKKAIAMLQDAVRIKPDFYENYMQYLDIQLKSYMKIALAYEKLGDFAEAEKYYLKTIKLYPQHADAHYNLGLLMTRRASDENDKSDAAQARGLINEARQRAAAADQYFMKAKELFYKAIQIAPNHVKALNNLGNIYFREASKKKALGQDSAKDFNEAIRLYLTALAAAPDYINSQMNLSLAYIEMGRYADAVPYLESIARQPLEPVQDLKVRYMLGTCYFSMNKFDQAASALRPAVDRYRNTPLGTTLQYVGTALRLSEVYARQGKFADCYAILSVTPFAITIPQQEMELRYRTGYCAARSGNKPAAITAFSALVQKYPSSSQAKQAQQALKALQAGATP
jgi:tetratricopeptide (TPR) repeat protein